MQRCGAKISHTPSKLARAAACGEQHLAALLRRTVCMNYPVRGKRRCWLHGGNNPGPVTIEGKQRTALNLPRVRAARERIKSLGGIVSHDMQPQGR